MAITIALPDAEKKVTIPYYNTMEELLESPDVHLRQLFYSYLFFKWLTAYAELFSQKVFPDEEIHAHLDAASMSYHNHLDVETLENDEISTKILEITESKEFEERYKPFIDNFTTEVFGLFARGALSLDAGVAVIDETPQFGSLRTGQA